MKKSSTKWRRLARWGLGSLTAIALVILLLPLWLPWVLRPVLGNYGLRFKEYHRVGFGHFFITDVSGQWKNTSLRAERVDCLQPATWLTHWFFSETNRPPALVMSNGIVIVKASTNAARDTKESSFADTLDEIAGIGVELRHYLLETRLTNCAVQVHSNLIAVQSAEWRDGRLHVRAQLANSTTPIEATVSEISRSTLSLSATSPPFALEGKFTRVSSHAAKNMSDWKWEGSLGWLTNRADVVGSVTTNSWWPRQATLASHDLRVPSDMFRVTGYEDIKAGVELTVVSNQFELSAKGSAAPLSETNGLPQVAATLHAKGDSESVTLDQLQLQTPWLETTLTNTIGIKRSGELLAKSARLQVNLDLTKLPGVRATGNASGFVSVEMNASNQPVALFDLAAIGVTLNDWEAKRFLLRGNFNWPVLTLQDLNVDLGDGSQFQVEGSADFSSQEVRGAKWRASGKFVEKFAPDLKYDKLTAAGEISGPFAQLAHQGSVKIENLQSDAIKPLSAKLEWTGTNLVFSSGNATVTAGKSKLELSGRFDFSRAGELAATLQEASLSRTNEMLYALEQPCALSFRYSSPQLQTNQWSLTADRFDWHGDGRELHFAGNIIWPTHAAFNASAKKVELEILEDFLKKNLGPIAIADFKMDAGWSNGPIHSTISAVVQIEDERGDVISAEGKIKTGEQVEIEELTVGSKFAPALHVQGSVPAKLVPSQKNDWLVVDENSAISLNASSQTTNQGIAVALGSLGSLRITNANVQLHASGTLAKPTANVVVNVASVDWQSATNIQKRPRLEKFQFVADVQPEHIQVRELTGTIDGQQIRATGEWPLADDFWHQLRLGRKTPDWSKANGRLQIEEADVAVISHYLPKVLAPEGRVKIDLTLLPGGKFGGLVVLTNAATRAIGDLVPLREVAARVKLEGSKAILEDFRGSMGGQPVRATGFVVIPLYGDFDYQVSLQSQNVPLVRSVEFLLRGDLNVELKGGKDSAPILSGDVVLRDGLFVEYASEFVWSKPKRPELQPPYFSITEDPFRDWKVNLAIRGEHFLRVKTPFFNGVVSANGKLQGTLAEPVITGDARIDSGRVIFPFGTLAVDQGYANLTGNDPRGPRLLINASGRNFNYGIHLEVKGPADGADILFTSAPPLTSEEILLMLTAGEIPQGQLFTYSTRDRAGQLATFVGKDLFSRYSGGGTTEEKLTLTTGESVTDEGKLTYSAEYHFDDRWSIVGEYDRFNAFNAHLKWKVFSY